ncbi:hypothetical protein H8E88_34285 [candidate division KSB1 bacterium]|nr:hypothetical protein [candidate division KSB1 bacterium]MBL7092729.1 hypothetical protein [candidate division KSB1 bacterium]
MKPKILVIVTLLSIIPLLVSAQSVKSTGIGLRGSFYQMTNGPMEVSVINHGQHTKANVGGGGGWLYLYSRVGDNLFLEINVGAVGEVQEETHNYYESTIDVSAITPILLGLRQEFLSPYNQSNLRPYFSFGAGPYWISDVIVREDPFSEEVTVNTTFERGGYLGGGFDFKLFSWFAINFDAKYHFIDFDKKHELSGVDYGLGITIMWGDYDL